MSPAIPPLDEKALQERLRQRAPEMRRTLDSMIPKYLRAQVSADDILQDTWVSAFRSIKSFRADRSDSLDRWLTSVANRTLLDKLRKAWCVRRGGPKATLRRADAPVSSLVHLFAEVTSPGKSPSRVVASSEAAVRINDALETLPAQQQRAIRLQYIDGLSRREIAESMQKTEAAVNSLIFHGLQSLKTRLGGDHNFFSDAKDPPP